MRRRNSWRRAAPTRAAISTRWRRRSIHLACGAPPPGAHERMTAVHAGRPDLLAIESTLPVRLGAVLLRALALDPAARFPARRRCSTRCRRARTSSRGRRRTHRRTARAGSTPRRRARPRSDAKSICWCRCGSQIHRGWVSRIGRRAGSRRRSSRCQKRSTSAIPGRAGDGPPLAGSRASEDRGARLHYPGRERTAHRRAARGILQAARVPAGAEARRLLPHQHRGVLGGRRGVFQRAAWPSRRRRSRHSRASPSGTSRTWCSRRRRRDDGRGRARGDARPGAGQ